MIIRFLDKITDIKSTQWEQLFNTHYPFTRYEFLAALESSQCVTTKTGWRAHHALVFEAETLIAAVPLYLKTHSYGEYVFDWSWANAYQQHGLAYYPKLVCAIPFTPSTGPRLAFSSSVTAEQEELIIRSLTTTIQERLTTLNGSSAHLLFPHENLSEQFSSQHWIRRLGIQYHWHNHNYQSFDDFLSQLKSRKRKMILKEREFVKQQGITLSTLEREQISDQLIRRFYSYYQQTYLKRNGSEGYLNLDFFHTVQHELAEQLVMVVAKKDDAVIAIALCFKDDEHLYGRYWGCHQEYDFLHFETCYYQGIEYCIRHGLKKFDAGAQGEHKLARGFTAQKTFSNHLILNEDFNHAIENFTRVEEKELERYLKKANAGSPFKTTAIFDD
ncbi:MAG: hypothetical protein A6F71_06980 [Cycloclasticus sp. symbiont of Poecilosclerida sp. M]|nr:MAG: hypothetical protein A6F71_06980 [Cycloclasticus sp. symbiont of Poecilosclerida sp. M]